MSDSLFRAEKETPNYNAFRTLLFGVFGALAILLLQDPVLSLWDTHLRDRPWVAASLVLVEGPDGRVRVDDTVTARWPVSGTRRDFVEVSGLRTCDDERHDSWPRAGGDRRLWSFEAFTGGCEVPGLPFRVCTKFVVESAREVAGAFGPFCSDEFDPRP